MRDKFHLGRVERGLSGALRKAIVNIGVTSQIYFKSNFDKEGFTDKSYERWKPRQTYRSRKSENRKILTKSGDLKRSIKRKTNAFALRVTITSGLPYSAIHNEGGTGNAFGTPFEMQQRQFIGDSDELDRKNIKIIETEIDKLFI